jgi:hypothetical protein
MDNAVVTEITCCQCHAAIDAGDHYCRRCGAVTGESEDGGAAAAVDARIASSHAASQPGCSENPWVILSLLFLAIGPFAIPLLWRSRRFTLLWKSVLTILVLVVTALLLWLLWVIAKQFIAPLREIVEILGP